MNMPRKMNRKVSRKVNHTRARRHYAFQVKSELATKAVANSPLPIKRTAVQVGPRGFRFSNGFLASVREGKGVAVSPANLPKLLSLAAHKGVRIPKRANLTPKMIAEHVSKAL
jgi:hypothetical protein